MNFQAQNNLDCQDIRIWRLGTIDLEVKKLLYNQYQLLTKKIQILQTKENLVYLEDGAILRNEQLKISNNHPQLLKYVDQIKYLQWEGQYGEKYKKKVGYWQPTWQGKELKGAGGYYDNGLKQGLWKELAKNYQIQAQIYEKGEYINDIKQGTWKYIYNNDIIGGGYYDYQGLKNGKWIELHDEFWKDEQILYIGEYKDNRKIGIWDIWFKEEYGIKFQQIGGGSYDCGGDNNKIGRWIEPIDGRTCASKATQNGAYKNGKKIGRWDIKQKGELMYNIKIAQQNSGGGLYDSEGNGHKIGKWVELNDRFDNWTFVTEKGKYQNGQRVGKWAIKFEEEKIGGGSYDEIGNGIKIGNWVELSYAFWRDVQVTQYGEYKNGKKVGRWFFENEEEQIGGGSYHEDGNETKIGYWGELSDEFSSGSEITYNGQYKDGKKVGRWDIMFRDEQIGGGSYDDEGYGLKIGKWIESTEIFGLGSEITYNGEYQNGKKVGKWLEMRDTQQQRQIDYDY
ncbi:unnamed protein product [Paramecium octaurelia]|uniref:Uncharacterized protein n=1 Tax=Paramecium octaurelia TaxID=43137 RepID=A0A8S1TQ32_PAROT|nr:unnamed protein product [Paramecium octaurelia]